MLCLPVTDSSNMAGSPRSFAAALRAGGVVFDGAMGTSLHAAGLPYSSCFEELNVRQPAVVQAVHRSFTACGCHVLTANTFGANMYRLKAHGLEARVREFNAAGVALARSEAEPVAAFVAGSVGPTGLLFRDVAEREHPAVVAAFRDQCDALVGAGADALLLETFRHSGELLLAVRAAVAARGTSTAPVIASVSIDDSGTTADGVDPRALAAQLAAAGADAVGVNCASGPGPVLAAVERIRDAGLPLVARPNAGLPRLHAGVLTYGVTAEDFGLAAGRLFAAGAAAVGGCCGTTPEHVRSIAAAAVARRSGLASCGKGSDTG